MRKTGTTGETISEIIERQRLEDAARARGIKVERPEMPKEGEAPPSPAEFAWMHFVKRSQQEAAKGGRVKKASMGVLMALVREALDVCARGQVMLDSAFVEAVGERFARDTDKECCARVARIMRNEEPLPETSRIVVPGAATPDGGPLIVPGR